MATRLMSGCTLLLIRCATPVKVFLRASGSHERAVLLRLLRMSETEHRHHWIAQIFRGEADSEPLTIASFGMTLEAAKAFPVAICLVNANNIKPGMLVKVIRVEGHMPDDPGYPLH